MLGSSKTNPVQGPLNLVSTVAWAQQLRECMIDWTSGEQWDPQSRALAQDDKERLGKWQSIFKDGREIIDWMERSLENPIARAYDQGFVYLFNGKPIGVMTVKKQLDNEYVFINDIIASPATSEAGCALIEAAVRWSEQSNCGGIVRLYAGNDKVGQVYKRYGFELTDPRRKTAKGRLHLNPLTSNAWERTAEGLSLKAKIGKAYAVSGLLP